MCSRHTDKMVYGTGLQRPGWLIFPCCWHRRVEGQAGALLMRYRAYPSTSNARKCGRCVTLTSLSSGPFYDPVHSTVAEKTLLSTWEGLRAQWFHRACTSRSSWPSLRLLLEPGGKQMQASKACSLGG